MKIQEYHEKRARYDPIAWSRCNICKEKYPNDEIVSHIHQKHPEKDCSTFSCWTCGIRFRKEAQMKRHMKTVKHELEAKKFIIPDEEPVDDEVHLVLIDQVTDLSQLQMQLNPADFITNVQPLNSSEIKEMNPPNNMTLQVSTNKETPLLMDHRNLATRKNSPNLMTQPVHLGTRISDSQDYLTETYNPEEHTEEGNQVILNDQTGILEENDRMNPKVTA